jgi:Acetoacetate decarboxylase (ADC)
MNPEESARALDYPPEPWDLRGHGYVSVWLVPPSALPGLPAGVTSLRVAGRAVVATAWVDYLPGGLLPYRELLAAVLVRRGRGVGASITDIWVDSPASLAGGRALWGIPKDLADFDMAHRPDFTATATVGGELVAQARFRQAPVGLPVPARGSIVQTLRGETAVTPIRVRGRVAPARSGWRIAADGPLGWLAPYPPVANLTITDFRMRFGPRKH